MARILALTTLLVLAVLANGQTYFYIDEIAVQPSAPSDQDNISIDLIGNLSSSNSYIVSASASVNGSQVTLIVQANSSGIGLPVLTPHTESLVVGQLAAGTYTIVINGQGTGDFAPTPQHQFTVSGGGDPCAALDLVAIQWHPFSDTAIVVHVQNNNTLEIFGYPNFILFDADGDTLAKELVNFFGIGDDSWHVLRIQDGVSIPPSPFSGTLELWVNFTTEMACSWNTEIDLCPPPPCITFYPTLENYGGMSVTGTFNWTILDDDGQVAGGTFSLTPNEQADLDTVCLPPGNYHIDVIPQEPPFPGGQLVYSVVGAGFIQGPSLPVSWGLPVLLPFQLVPACISGTNGSEEPVEADWSMHLTGDLLWINSNLGKVLGPVAVFDPGGRLVATASGNSATVTMPLDQVAPGILLVHVAGTTSRIALVR